MWSRLDMDAICQMWPLISSSLLALCSSSVDMGTAQTWVNFGSGWRIRLKTSSQHMVWVGIRMKGGKHGIVIPHMWLGCPWYSQIILFLILSHFGSTHSLASVSIFGIKSLPCIDALAQDSGAADSFLQARLTSQDGKWELSKIDRLLRCLYHPSAVWPVT